jgi:hypothetical protein
MLNNRWNKKNKTLVKNSDKINTKLNLFNMVDGDLIERPKTGDIEDVIAEIVTEEEEIELEKKRKLNLKRLEVTQLAKIEQENDITILNDFTRKRYLDTAKLPTIKVDTARARKKPVEQYLSVKLGSDGRKLLDRIIEQALYVYDAERDKGKPKYPDETVRFSQKILFEYGFFKPTIKQEKTVDVSVEHKLDDALKAIHDNRERIKLLK